jgi:hypothetical protein
MIGPRFVNQIDSFNGSGFDVIYKQYAEVSLNQPQESLKKFIEDTSTQEELYGVQKELEENTQNPRIPLSGLASLQKGAESYQRSNYVEQVDPAFFDLLEQAGWVKDDVQWKIEPGHVLMYRYKVFRVEPGVELDSGKMIVEAASAGLETHTPNIVLQSHTIPTAQFLGASSSNITMQLFVNAELSEHQPVGTSIKLMEFTKILEEVNLDAILYHRQSFNDSLFLRHPLAKLCKYKPYSNDRLPAKVYDPYSRSLVEGVDLNEYLACTVEDMSSETVEGHPFCSRVTVNFVENYVNQESNLKSQTVGQGQTAYDSFKGLINTLAARWGIQNVAQETAEVANEDAVFDRGTRGGRITEDRRRFSGVKNNFTTSDYPIGTNPEEEKIALDLVSALNVSSSLDYSTEKGGTAGFPFTSVAQAMEHPFTITVRKQAVANLLYGQLGTENVTPFTYEEFMRLGERLILLAVNGRPAGNPYGKFVDVFNKVTEVPTESAYPDMMLPDDFPQPDHAWFNLTDYRDSRERLERLTKSAFDTRRLVGVESAKYRSPEAMPEELKAKEFIPNKWGPAPAANPLLTASEDYKDGIPFSQNPLELKQQAYSTARSMEEWQELTYTMRRAMPTFKIYFKEDLPETEDGTLESNPAWRNLNDVYDLNGIIDIRLSKKQDNPADLLVIRMTNSRQDFMSKYYTVRQLSNKQAIADSRSKRSIRNATTPDEASKSYRALHARGDAKVLREGTRVELRMGYDNNPNNLNIEFTGRIMSANGTDIIEIICQGDGVELLQDIKGVGGKDEELDTTTGKAIAEFLERCPEIQSFGTSGNNTKWFGDVILPVNFGGRSILENIFAPTLYSGWENFGSSLKYSTWAATGAAVATIAAPFTGGLSLVIAGGLGALSTVLFAGGLIVDSFKAAKFMIWGVPFKVYEQTPWEVLQELTLRHPGVICSVVPFGGRSTIFFGYPDQLYFHRPATFAERVVLRNGDATNTFTKTTRRDILKNKQGDRVFGAHDFSREDTNALRQAPGSGVLAYQDASIYQGNGYNKENIPRQPGENKPGELARMAMKPFINYHVVTSMHDIVFNEIKVTTDDVYNAVRVLHPDDSGLVGDADKNFDGSAGFEDYIQTDTIQADDDLIRNYIKLQTLVFHNASNHPLEDLPERYAINSLAKNLENIYSGKLTILGRPKVKPHDIVFIEDFYSGISGPVKVGAVTHVLSYKTGWITEIHPKLVVSHYSATLIDQVRAMKEVAKEVALQNLSTFQSGYIAAQREPEDFGKVLRDNVNSGIRKSLGTAIRGKMITAGVATAAKAYTESYRSAANAAYSTAFKNAGKVNISDFSNASFSTARNASRAGGAPFTAQAAAGRAASKSVGKAGVAFRSLKVASKAAIFLWGIEYAITNYVNWSRTRQPIAFDPLLRGGSPWIMGLWGFLNNSEAQAMAKVVGKMGGQALNIVEAAASKFTGRAVTFDYDVVEKARAGTETAIDAAAGGANRAVRGTTKFFSNLTLGDE